MDTSRRTIRWNVLHENGWTTAVAQQPDGTFIPYIAADRLIRFSIRGTALEDALQASQMAIATVTGHSACSEACSEWALTVSEVGDGEELDALFGTVHACAADGTSSSVVSSGNRRKAKSPESARRSPALRSSISGLTQSDSSGNVTKASADSCLGVSIPRTGSSNSRRTRAIPTGATLTVDSPPGLASDSKPHANPSLPTSRERLRVRPQGTPVPEYWFVVSPDNPELFAALSRVLATTTGYHVLIDRRVAQAAAPPVERRTAHAWKGNMLTIAECVNCS